MRWHRLRKQRSLQEQVLTYAYLHKGINETPYEYLMEYRIGQAQRLLKQTEKSVLEIANETGFSEGAYFAKIFKRAAGKTPLQYRKEQK